MTTMPPLSNVQKRDIEAVFHPYSPLHKLPETGGLVVERGEGVFIYDTQGNEYIEGIVGSLVCRTGFRRRRDDRRRDGADENPALLPSVCRSRD